MDTEHEPIKPDAAKPAVFERTYPLDAPEPTAAVSTPAPTPKPHKGHMALYMSVVVVGIAIIAYVSYMYGYLRGQYAVISHDTAQTVVAALKVPQGATIIEQCAVGRGAQFVAPSNIPHGPVYNVYGGKVIGIEYMISPTDLTNGTSYLNLPMFGQTYDHVDIGLQSAGHAGYPEPHYHIDLYKISRAASQAITCK